MTDSLKVYKTDISTETYIDEDCYIVEVVNEESQDISIARSRVLPGVTTILHSLNKTKEFYYILEGSGLMYINGREAQLKKGDCVVIEPDIPQRITNNGHVDLIFLCICQPRFQFDNYKDLR